MGFSVGLSLFKLVWYDFGLILVFRWVVLGCSSGGGWVLVVASSVKSYERWGKNRESDNSC